MIVLRCTRNAAVMFFLLLLSALVMMNQSQSFVITDILFNEMMEITVPFRY